MLQKWKPSKCAKSLAVEILSNIVFYSDIGDGGDELGVVRLGVDQSPISCSVFSPSNLLLAACSDEKKLKVWRIGSFSVAIERSVLARGSTSWEWQIVGGHQMCMRAFEPTIPSSQG